MEKVIQKISADSVCDKTMISNKIDQARHLANELQRCVDIISLLDDGCRDSGLHDQLTGTDDIMASVHHMIKRLDEVNGDLHMLDDESRSAQIKKWAIANRS
tara:strand:- start:19 stop:324 length:306 start_codon:yes stop_codon:yes gene_type:complete